MWPFLNDLPLPHPSLQDDFLIYLGQNPRAVLEYYAELFPALYRVNKATWEKCLGAQDKNKTPVSKQFQHPAWSDHPYFFFLLNTYEAYKKSWKTLLERSTLSSEQKTELTFYLNQYISALSPKNFPTTNPELFQKLFSEGTQPFEQGLENIRKDWQEKGPLAFIMSLTKPKAFQIGQNLALTPGAVIFRNDLFELIHYTPVVKTTHSWPVLLVPPWINKFYIFDLRPNNSFVLWLLQQGIDVFCISWVNPEPKKKLNFLSYLNTGLLKAISVMRSVCSAEKVNVMGYCLGGNLLLCALSKLQKENTDHIRSATFLTTITDFSKIEALGVFLKDRHWPALKQSILQTGFVDGYALGSLFSILRSNELIWPSIINRYFLNKEPPPLDFLHWNADSVRLPADMYCDFVEQIVQRNGFINPEGLSFSGESALSFNTLSVPSFIMAARNDHIAPWRSCFPLFQKMQGPKTFVLSTSGHVAGVINPPNEGKYSFLTAPLDGKESAATDDQWIGQAEEKKGSWWTAWLNWAQPHLGPLKTHSGSLGNQEYPPLEPAPGSYIKSAVQNKTRKTF